MPDEMDVDGGAGTKRKAEGEPDDPRPARRIKVRRSSSFLWSERLTDL